jgi:hypothetical protein
MHKIGSQMKRIAPLTVFFAAFLDFVIECARFDLWIMAIVVVILMGSAKGTLASRLASQKRDRCASISRR